MKKTLILIASLASCSLSAQAATLWTTTFGNAAQTNATDVRLINTGEMSDITGAVVSLKSTANAGGLVSDILLQTGGTLGEDASLFTPNVNVQKDDGGSWTAGMVFTNEGSQGCSISSVKMTMVSFKNDGESQTAGEARTFSLTLEMGGKSKSATLTIPGNSGATGKAVTLTFDSPVELDVGQSLNFSVLASRTNEVKGCFFGIKSMEFQGGLMVPEPATASLGLLGLAALMVRRRRA